MTLLLFLWMVLGLTLDTGATTTLGLCPAPLTASFLLWFRESKTMLFSSSPKSPEEEEERNKEFLSLFLTTTSVWSALMARLMSPCGFLRIFHRQILFCFIIYLTRLLLVSTMTDGLVGLRCERAAIRSCRLFPAPEPDRTGPSLASPPLEAPLLGSRSKRESPSCASQRCEEKL